MTNIQVFHCFNTLLIPQHRKENPDSVVQSSHQLKLSRKVHNFLIRERALSGGSSGKREKNRASRGCSETLLFGAKLPSPRRQVLSEQLEQPGGHPVPAFFQVVAGASGSGLGSTLAEQRRRTDVQCLCTQWAQLLLKLVRDVPRRAWLKWAP